MTRVNERIRAPRVRVVSGKGEQLGVMDTREAVQRAKAIGLDLVEVAAKADPPVCRVVDYGKWKYEQSKLKKTSKSKSVTRLKEIKFRVRTEQHDYNIKLGRIEAFLEEANQHNFAAICVLPEHVKMARSKSAGSIACAAGGFPNGDGPLHERIS